MDERNALSELAEFLKKEASPSSEEFKAKAIAKFGVESWKRHEERKHKFLRASQIIAELAKVKDIKEFGVVHVREDMAIDAIENCRAIAEEGVSNGK